jgi:hypothetical protein
MRKRGWNSWKRNNKIKVKIRRKTKVRVKRRNRKGMKVKRKNTHRLKIVSKIRSFKMKNQVDRNQMREYRFRLKIIEINYYCSVINGKNVGGF